MNKALGIWVMVFLLLCGSCAQAMFWTAQDLPGVGQAVFTGKERKCLVCFAKRKDDTFFLLLKDITTSQANTQMFSVSEMASPLSPLYSLLFPSMLKDTFIFDSSKITEYKDALNEAAKDQDWVNWWNARKSTAQKAKSLLGFGAKSLNAFDIKSYLKKEIDNFSENIKKLIPIEPLAESENILTLIGQTVIYDVSQGKENSVKLKVVQDNLIPALFGNFKTEPNVSFNNFAQLDKQEIKNLESIVQSVMMSQFCYVSDLAKANLLTVLPRAIYKEVQKLGLNIGFGVQSFDPYLYTQFPSDLSKTLLLGTGGFGAAWLYSKLKGK